MPASAEFVLDHLPQLLFGFPGQRPGGLVLSILLAVVGVGAGFLVALPIAAAMVSPHRGLRWIGEAYVFTFRGIPLVLLVLFVHQLAGGATTPLVSACVALVLYSSAYQSDIIRTGARSVPVAMVESARVMGGSRSTANRKVVLPYSVRVMLPALTGQAITAFKDSAVVVIIGVADLTTTARVVLGGDVLNAPFWVATYLAVGMLYFVTAFGLSRIALRLEARLRRPDPLSPATRPRSIALGKDREDRYPPDLETSTTGGQ